MTLGAKVRICGLVNGRAFIHVLVNGGTLLHVGGALIHGLTYGRTLLHDGRTLLHDGRTLLHDGRAFIHVLTHGTALFHDGTALIHGLTEKTRVQKKIGKFGGKVSGASGANGAKKIDEKKNFSETKYFYNFKKSLNDLL
jgi:hypothetical protein